MERSFATVIDLGSYAKTSCLPGHSTSKVSVQGRTVTEQAVAAIVRQSGQELALTEAGEAMLLEACRPPTLNDVAA